MTFYARAHCGDAVQVRIGGPKAFTDGYHIYLPDKIEAEKEVARQMYQTLTARNAGYIEFGTMDLDLHLVQGDWVQGQEDEIEVDQLKVGIATADPKLAVPPVAPVVPSELENIYVAAAVSNEPPWSVAVAPPAQTMVTSLVPKPKLTRVLAPEPM